MKNYLKVFAVIFAVSIAIFSCKGPEGPAGPAGADGVDGINGLNGTDGTDGVDGNVTCLVCHSANVKNEIALTFHNSQHFSGDIAVSYAGGRGSCSPCHSHELYVAASLGLPAADVTHPTAWQCATCHDLHNTFEATDYAFRMGTSFALLADTATTFDHGNNNVCAYCHQYRRDYDSYAFAAAGTSTKTFTGADYAVYSGTTAGTIDYDNGVDTVVVTFTWDGTTNAFISSTHGGPHHGPQANNWIGDNTHLTSAGISTIHSWTTGCTACHMDGNDHSFNPNLDLCSTCHSDVEGKMDDVALKIYNLGMALEAVHAVHYDGETFHPVYAVLDMDVFGVWWDFMTVLEDKSNGAHNPELFNDIFDNAEAVLGVTL